MKSKTWAQTLKDLKVFTVIFLAFAGFVAFGIWSTDQFTNDIEPSASPTPRAGISAEGLLDAKNLSPHLNP